MRSDAGLRRAGEEAFRAMGLELAQATGSTRADTLLDGMAGALAGNNRVLEVGQFLALPAKMVRDRDVG
ncbi:hypothetical protein FF36_05227 [Frankia torreyi]|uniref:Uncharacterized protein n=2 Tax=Frankiaceae TaxID=74712 RepID=A0A0D8B963_9ACTN|nr:hypothetical protein FF36_05227 [Frankia torreyi]KQM02969.1 hypothetical protein FF86_105122 [Frankia sp. CpI1-P]